MRREMAGDPAAAEAAEAAPTIRIDSEEIGHMLARADQAERRGDGQVAQDVRRLLGLYDETQIARARDREG